MKVVVGLAIVLFALGGSVSAQGNRYQHNWPDTDFSLALVDIGEIRGGGPPKDGIPAIDRPMFDTVAEASRWLDPREPVIAVKLGVEARAYPLQILMYHEIVNDEMGGRPLSITFCPLCNASIVFDRRVNGRLLDFGTTGLLRKSDLVMYDRQTESWWQQFSGRAIVGEQVGTVLDRVPSAIVSFETFSSSYPDGKLLNRDTGYNRPYGSNPYEGYDDIDSSPFLFSGRLDQRLPPMERVLSISIDSTHRIYPFSVLDTEKLVNDRVEQAEVVVFAGGTVLSALDDDDIASSRKVAEATAWRRHIPGRSDPLSFVITDERIIDRETGSVWNALGQAIEGQLEGAQLDPVDSGVHFAFAWLAFNPETDIYGR